MNIFYFSYSAMPSYKNMDFKNMDFFSGHFRASQDFKKTIGISEILKSV